MAIEKTLINGETVYLKKNGILGWGVVHPIRNEDGKINTVNLLFGGKGNLIMLIIMLIVIGSGVYGYAETTQSCRHLAENPCDYVCCPNCDAINYSKFDNRTLNWLSISHNTINLSISQ